MQPVLASPESCFTGHVPHDYARTRRKYIKNLALHVHDNANADGQSRDVYEAPTGGDHNALRMAILANLPQMLYSFDEPAYNSSSQVSAAVIQERILESEKCKGQRFRIFLSSSLQGLSAVSFRAGGS